MVEEQNGIAMFHKITAAVLTAAFLATAGWAWTLDRRVLGLEISANQQKDLLTKIINVMPPEKMEKRVDENSDNIEEIKNTVHKIELGMVEMRADIKLVVDAVSRVEKKIQ